MADVVEINALTGEVVERDFTEAERAQRELDAEAAADAFIAQATAERERDELRHAALAKLEKLGLTEAEAAEIAGF